MKEKRPQGRRQSPGRPPHARCTARNVSVLLLLPALSIWPLLIPANVRALFSSAVTARETAGHFTSQCQGQSKAQKRRVAGNVWQPTIGHRNLTPFARDVITPVCRLQADPLLASVTPCTWTAKYPCAAEENWQLQQRKTMHQVDRQTKGVCARIAYCTVAK